MVKYTQKSDHVVYGCPLLFHVFNHVTEMVLYKWFGHSCELSAFFLLRLWLSSQGHRFHIKMLIYITLKIYKSQLSKTNVASFFVETNNIISFWTFSHFMMYLTLQRMKKIAIISPLSIRYGADSTLQFSQRTLNTRDTFKISAGRC